MTDEGGASLSELECVEFSAALGTLLNTLAHELNNHLTNLVLATENARHDQTDASFDLLARQCKQAASLTAAMQQLGSQNLVSTTTTVHLAELAEQVQGWLSLGGDEGTGLEVVVAGDPIVQAPRHHLSLAFSLLIRILPSPPSGTIRLAIGTEDVLRSRWSDEDQYVPMAVVRLSSPGASREAWPPFELSDLVDGFFSGERSHDEVRGMGAWEIIRKVVGRPTGRLQFGPAEEDCDPQVVVCLPLAVD